MVKGSQKTGHAQKGSVGHLKNEDNRTEKQKKIFQRVPESHLEVSKAWKLREDFKSLFESRSFKDAIQYARLWMDYVFESGI